VVSSTSNFDQFPERERWLRPWLFALLATLCFAVFVDTSRFSWFFDPTSWEKRVETVQQQAVAPRANARIIILGTSRAAYGLVPSTIERVLNRPALSVANWAYPGFGREPYDLLVNSEKEKIAAAEIIVVQIDPYFGLTHKTNLFIPSWAMTRNWALVLNHALQRKLGAIAPIADKMAWFGHEFGSRLGWVQPWRLNWIMLPSGNWEAENWVLSDADAPTASETVANSYFKEKVVDSQEVLGWKQFFQSLASLNRRVLLVYLPSAPTFVIAERTYADVIGENRRIFGELAKENGFQIIEMTSAECGLADNMFSDPVHVNHPGREHLSECFTQMLTRELLIR
jgi:hypothetical protein